MVDGQPVAPGRGAGSTCRASARSSSSSSLRRRRRVLQANALRVEVSDPAAAAVIGQPFVLGHLELSATPGTAAPARGAGLATPPRLRAPRPTAPATRRRARRGGRPRRPRRRRRPSGCPAGRPRRSRIPRTAGYVFPVVGRRRFTDDYGAPRADTGWHHGNDLFAPRHAGRGGRRRHPLAGRRQHARRQPPLADRRARQRVLLRPPVRLRARPPWRAPGCGRAR